MTIEEADKIFDQDGVVYFQGQPYSLITVDKIHNTVAINKGPVGTVVKVSELDEARSWQTC